MTPPKKTKQDYEEMTLEELDYYLVVKGTGKVGDKVRQLCRAWNRELTKESCQVCGYDKHVELAHLKPVSSFEKTTKLKEINHPDNILVLCPNHHFEFDAYMILIEDIPMRKTKTVVL